MSSDVDRFLDRVGEKVREFVKDAVRDGGIRVSEKPDIVVRPEPVGDGGKIVIEIKTP